MARYLTTLTLLLAIFAGPTFCQGKTECRIYSYKGTDSLHKKLYKKQTFNKYGRLLDETTFGKYLEDGAYFLGDSTDTLLSIHNVYLADTLLDSSYDGRRMDDAVRTVYHYNDRGQPVRSDKYWYTQYYPNADGSDFYDDNRPKKWMHSYCFYAYDVRGNRTEENEGYSRLMEKEVAAPPQFNTQHIVYYNADNTVGSEYFLNTQLVVNFDDRCEEEGQLEMEKEYQYHKGGYTVVTSAIDYLQRPHHVGTDTTVVTISTDKDGRITQEQSVTKKESTITRREQTVYEYAPRKRIKMTTAWENWGDQLTTQIYMYKLLKD